MLISCNFNYIIKLNFLIGIFLVSSVTLSKANVLKENQVQSGDSLTEHGTLQLSQTKEFMSLTETNITKETDDKNAENPPPQGTTPTAFIDPGSTPTIPTVKIPVKNRRSICNNKKGVGKNVKRRTKPSSHKLSRKTPEQRHQQSPPPDAVNNGLGNLNNGLGNPNNGLGSLNDLIRGVQIFNDPKVTQDINAFKTLLDAFEQMKKTRNHQEDGEKNGFDDSISNETTDDEPPDDNSHLIPRNTGNGTSVKVKVIPESPPSNYSHSGPKVNVTSNKNFSLDYDDDYNTNDTTEEDGDQEAADYRPDELLPMPMPNKRSIRRHIVRESSPSLPKANNGPKPSAAKPTSKTPPASSERASKTPPANNKKPPTEAPAKVVPPPVTSRHDQDIALRITRNSTSNNHFNSLQDLWRDYQIAIVMVPAVFLVVLLMIIIYLIGKTGKGYMSVPSSSYDSDNEISLHQGDVVSKNCPPQKEYLPYMDPEPKRGEASESERIIKTLGGYSLIRTKGSIEDLLNQITPPSSAKSVATQVNDSSSLYPHPDTPSVSQPQMTESRGGNDNEDDVRKAHSVKEHISQQIKDPKCQSIKEDIYQPVNDPKCQSIKESTSSQPIKETKKPTGCLPTCSPRPSNPASSESNPPKKPKRRRKKQRKSPSLFKGCMSGPTDESDNTEEDDCYRLPSNDEAIQSVVTQGASLIATERPVKGTKNEMQEMLRTDVKRIDDMLTDGNWERAYYKKGGNVQFSDGPGSESPGPTSSERCRKGGASPRIAPSEDGVFTMKYYLGSSADLTQRNPALQRPF